LTYVDVDVDNIGRGVQYTNQLRESAFKTNNIRTALCEIEICANTRPTYIKPLNVLNNKNYWEFFKTSVYELL